MALKLNLRTGHISIQQMLNTIKTQKAIKNGNKYTVYLDYRGRIAGYDLLKTDDIQYGS